MALKKQPVERTIIKINIKDGKVTNTGKIRLPDGTFRVVPEAGIKRVGKKAGGKVKKSKGYAKGGKTKMRSKGMAKGGKTKMRSKGMAKGGKMKMRSKGMARGGRAKR